LEFQPDEMGSAHGSLANDFSGIFPIVEKEVQVEKPEEQPLMKKMEELIERLSLKELEINKLNELARQVAIGVDNLCVAKTQDHGLAEDQCRPSSLPYQDSPQGELQTLSRGMRAEVTFIFDKLFFRTPDRNIADILLNNLFQFFEVTE
jgi:hypothetical protein